MCHLYWPGSYGYGLKIKTNSLQAPLCSTPLLQYRFIFNGTKKCRKKAHEAASPWDETAAVDVAAAAES